MKPFGSDEEVTNDLWENNFIRMASAETRFQGCKEEGSKNLDTLSVVIFFQKACQGLEGRERLATCINSKVERKEPSEAKMLK